MARELDIVITADGSQAKRELQAVDTAVQKTVTSAGSLDTATGKLQDTFNKLDLSKVVKASQAGLEEVGKTVAEQSAAWLGWGAAGAAAAVGIGTAMVSLAESSATALEGIRSFGVMTGETVGQVERLQAIADLGGSSLQEMGGLAQVLETRLLATGAAAERFDTGLAALNINAASFRNAAFPDQVLMLSEGFQRGAENGGALAASVEILGRAGRQYLPFLTKDLGEIADRAGDVQLNLGTKDVKAAEDFEAATRTLHVEWTNFKTEFGAGFIIPVTFVIRAVDAAGHAMGVAGGALGGLLNPGAIGNNLVQPYADAFANPNMPTPPTGPSLPIAQTPRLGYDLNTPEGRAAADADAKYLKDLDTGKVAVDQYAASVQALMASYEALVPHADAVIDATRRIISTGGESTATDNRMVEALNKMHEAQQAIPPDLEAWREAQNAFNVAEREHVDLLNQQAVALDTLGTKLPALSIGVTNSTYDWDASNRSLEEGVKSVGQFVGVLPNVTSSMHDMHEEIAATDRDALKVFSQDLRELGHAFENLASVSHGSMSAVAKDLAQVVTAMNVVDKGITTFTNGREAGGFTGLLGQATGLISAGAGFLQATDPSHGTGGAIAGGASTGAEIGFAAGGPIGAGIGAGVGALVGWARTLGQVSEAEKVARTQQDQLVKGLQLLATESEKSEGALTDTYHALAIVGRDAFLQIGLSAAQTDKMVQDLLNTSDPARFAAAAAQLATVVKLEADISTGVTAVQTAFGAAGEYIPKALRDSITVLAQMPGLTDAERKSLQDLVAGATPTFDQLITLGEKYNLTLADMGHGVQQLGTEKGAKTLVADFTELTDAGVDAGTVVAHMATQIQSLVTDALHYGTAIPESMQPLIQALINQGNLFDLNHKKITDMTGLTFEQTPLEKGLSSLTTAIQTLIDTLKLVPGVAQDVAKQIPNNPFANWGMPSGGSGYGAGVGTGSSVPPSNTNYTQLLHNTGIPGYATGGIVGGSTVSGGDDQLGTLARGEVVLNASEQRAVGALIQGGSGSSETVAELRRLRTDVGTLRTVLQQQAASMALMPAAIVRGTRDAALIANA